MANVKSHFIKQLSSLTKGSNYKPRNATYLYPIENTDRFKSSFIDRPIFDKDLDL